MEAHGTATYRWQGDIFITHLHGAFNHEGLLRAEKKRNKAIAQQAMSIWYRIIWFDDDVFTSAEVAKYATGKLQESIPVACLGTVYVFSESFQKNIQSRAFSPTMMKRRYVTTMEQAFVAIDEMRQLKIDNSL